MKYRIFLLLAVSCFSAYTATAQQKVPALSKANNPTQKSSSRIIDTKPLASTYSVGNTLSNFNIAEEAESLVCCLTVESKKPRHLHHSAIPEYIEPLRPSFNYYLSYGVDNGYTSFYYRNVNDAGAGKSAFFENVTLSNIIANPEISFTSATGTARESSATNSVGCRTYTDYTINLQITSTSTQDATVLISATGTATGTSDYELMNSSVLFPAGSTSNHPITLRVFGDSGDESDESIILSLSLSGSTDAVLSPDNSTHVVTILDHNSPIGPAYQTETIFTEGFDSGLRNWKIVKFSEHHYSSPNTWYSGNLMTIGGSNTAYVTESATRTAYHKTRATDVALVSPLIDPLDLKSLELSFYFAAGGEAGYDYGLLLYALESDPNTYYIFDGNRQGPYLNTPSSSAILREVKLPAALEGQRFYLAWNWVNDDNIGTDPAFIVDAIQLTGKREVQSIETTLNATGQVYLGPYTTATFYDATNGELMAQIQNNSSWDYGCTTLTIDRSGSTSKEFWSAGPAYSLADKTVRVIPTNNKPEGAYTITLFYTEEEIKGWELASGKNRSQLQIAKISGATIDQIKHGTYPVGAKGYLSGNTSSQAFGQLAWQVQGSFSSGFSGFGVGDPGDPPASLPITLLQLSGYQEQASVVLKWSTTTEENSAYFTIEHSSDGYNFRTVGQTAAVGHSKNIHQYSFIHHPEVPFGNHYYRLRMVDTDESFAYSDILYLFQGFSEPSLHKVFPNPTRNSVSIEFNAHDTADLWLELRNIKGVPVFRRSFRTQNGYNKVLLDLEAVPAGVYLLQLITEQRSLQEKLMILE